MWRAWGMAAAGVIHLGPVVNRSRQHPALALALVGAIALAGCGGSSHSSTSSAPTKAQYLQQIDAICSAVAAKTEPLVHQLTAAAPSLASGSPQAARQVAPLVEKLHQYGATSLAQLRALKAPAGEQKAVEAFLSPLTNVIAAAGQAASSLSAGQVGPAVGLLSEVESNAQQATTAARAYGAPPCGAVVSALG